MYLQFLPVYGRQFVDQVLHIHHCVRSTLRLAVSISEWLAAIRDRHQRAVGFARNVVRKFLTRELGRDKSVASRLLDLSDFIEVTERKGLDLSRIRSRGVLDAIVAATNRHKKSGATPDLQELVGDASSMTISDFRSKYLSKGQRRQQRSTLTLDEVSEWLRNDATPPQIEAVRGVLSTL